MGFTRQARQLLICLFLLAPAVALSAITGVDRGTGGNANSEASTTIAPGSDFTTGSIGILTVAADNANGSTTNHPVSITDSKGNIWYRRLYQAGSSTANINLDASIYIGVLTNGFTTSDSLVLTYVGASVASKVWTLIEATPATAGNIILGAATAQNAVATSGTPSLTPGGLLQIGDMIVGMVGAESGTDTFTGDSDTSNGSWSTQQHTAAGVTTTGMSITSQYKVQTTAVAQQTYNPTLTSADEIIAAVILREVPPKCRFVDAISGAAQATTTVTFGLPLAQNSMGVLCLAADNAGTNGDTSNLPTSLIDSQSNTWTLQQTAIYDNGAASAGAEMGIYTAPITTALGTTDTVGITYTIATVGAKSCAVFEFSDATAYNAGGVGAGVTSATPTITTASITNGHYVVAMVGSESTNTFTADTDTSNGAWSSPAIGEQGTSPSGMTLIAQYKKVTATATQTYNPTLTSADVILGYVDLTAPTSTSATNGFFQY